VVHTSVHVIVSEDGNFMHWFYYSYMPCTNLCCFCGMNKQTGIEWFGARHYE
jgi:hypothetical protein